MLEMLRAELKAIQDWPDDIVLVTETERDAIFIRYCRSLELREQIAQIAVRN
jgi:hypothetical protein